MTSEDDHILAHGDCFPAATHQSAQGRRAERKARKRAVEMEVVEIRLEGDCARAFALLVGPGDPAKCVELWINEAIVKLFASPDAPLPKPGRYLRDELLRMARDDSAEFAKFGILR